MKDVVFLVAWLVLENLIVALVCFRHAAKKFQKSLIDQEICHMLEAQNLRKPLGIPPE